MEHVIELHNPQIQANFFREMHVVGIFGKDIGNHVISTSQHIQAGLSLSLTFCWDIGKKVPAAAMMTKENVREHIDFQL